MPIQSPFPPAQIPQTDLLSYLFPRNKKSSSEPIWIDADDPRNNLSPRKLLTWVTRLAVGLEKLGTKPGDVVVIFTPNHIFIPVAYLGVSGSRRIFSGINPNYTPSEVAYQLKDTGAKVLLAHPSLAETAIKGSKEAGLPLDRVFLFSDKPVTSIHGIQDWRSMIGTLEEGKQWKWKPMAPEESTTTLATVNYSSGTTGLPKGVSVSHANIIANLEQANIIRSHKRQPRKERWLGFLPLYHAYGQLFTISLAVRLNTPVHIMRQFHFEDFLRAIERYKITNLQVAPPILVMLSKRPETANYDLSSVTDIMCGAAPLSKELQNDVSERFNVQINQGWGMTETVCGAHNVPGGIKDDSGSVGQLFPNTECKLVDDTGVEVGPGQPGEMWIRGPQVCVGYWKNEKATKETITADGWLKTGDIAIARDGWFWIVDRKKELIKVNGLQVAPAELEAALLECDDVEDVGVVGITLNGEEWPRAYIHLKAHAKGRVTEADIQAFMKTKVARHKQLVGGIAFVDEVPKLPSGKIVRKLLKEWAKRDAAMMVGGEQAKL